MILVDTSVWADHLGEEDAGLVQALDEARVLMHPFVIGELACGNLPDRANTLEYLADLPSLPVATHTEALTFIEQGALMGSGIGYIDVHLLASVVLEGTARLWTRDRRLRTVASEVGVAYEAGGNN